MISKVLIHKYLIVKQFNFYNEIETNTFDVTNLILDNDYKLNYRLEFGDILEQIPSDITLDFDNDFIEGQNFTLREFLLDIPRWELQFAGISIYIDNNEIPEFWGQIDFTTLIYDVDNDIISFSAFDFIKKYLAIWKEKRMPNIWNDYNSLTNINEVLGLVIDRSTLLNDYVYNCGVLNNAKIGTRELRLLYASQEDDPYTIEEFVNILRKKFMAYLFIDGRRKLNFVTASQYIEDAQFDEDKIIKVERDTYPYPKYSAAVVSYSFINEFPYALWVAGIEYVVGDRVVYIDSVYECQIQHISSNDTRPDLDPGKWLFIERLDLSLIYPSNYMAGTPYAVLIEKGGKSFVLPYFEEATITDLGMPTLDMNELVKKYRPKHLESYLNLIPEVRVPKNYPIERELAASEVLVDVTARDIYNVIKFLIPDKYLEQIRIEYDGYDFRLMQRVNYNDKNFVIVEITKFLNNETCEMVLREMYE